MLKLAVIYGGMSTEHDVSMVSGKNVIDNLDRKKYEIYPVEITKEGIWKREGNSIYLILNLNPNALIINKTIS